MTKIVLFALISAIAALVTKQLHSDFFAVVVACASVAMALLVCDSLFEAVYTFYNFSAEAGVDSEAISCVIKVVGIGYLAEFSNSLCVDVGCKSIGDKVLLASKISILFCAMPVVEKLFALIRNMVA